MIEFMKDAFLFLALLAGILFFVGVVVFMIAAAIAIGKTTKDDEAQDPFNLEEYHGNR